MSVEDSVTEQWCHTDYSLAEIATNHELTVEAVRQILRLPDAH